MLKESMKEMFLFNDALNTFLFMAGRNHQRPFIWEETHSRHFVIVKYLYFQSYDLHP